MAGAHTEDDEDEGGLLAGDDGDADDVALSANLVEGSGKGMCGPHRRQRQQGARRCAVRTM